VSAAFEARHSRPLSYEGVMESEGVEPSRRGVQGRPVAPNAIPGLSVECGRGGSNSHGREPTRV
jgi:hypothetical protein